MKTIVERIENPRVRPDHIDVTDAPVKYAPPKRSFLDPQTSQFGSNEGMKKEHLVKTAFRMLRRQLNTNAQVAPEEIEVYSTAHYGRMHRKELEQPRMAQSMSLIQRFGRLITTSFL